MEELVTDIEQQEPPQQEEPPKKYKVNEFAAKIKAKYPEYKDMDDTELSKRIVAKYPEYKDHVDFGVDVVEKKNPSEPISKDLQTTSQLGKLPTATVDYLYPSEKKMAAKAGVFLMPPKDQEKAVQNIISNRKLVAAPKEEKPLSDYLPDMKAKQPMAAKDMTYMEKPITDVDIAEKEKSYKRHQENIAQAVDNTTQRYFKAKGMVISPGTPIYNEQKRKILKAVENGDATLHIKDGVPLLDKKRDFIPDLIYGWNQATDANDEAASFVYDMNTQQRVDYVNKKKQEQKNNEGYLGETGGVGEFLGGAAPMVAKGAAGAVLGSMIAATAPETAGLSLTALPTAMAFISTAPDMANMKGQEEVLRRFEIIKHQNPNISDYDAMEEANSGLLSGMIGGVAENALMMKGMRLPISQEGKQAIGKFATETLKSGMNMGGAAAVTDVAQKVEGGLEGYKSTPEETLKSGLNTFLKQATVGSILHVVVQGAAGTFNVPKAVNSAFKYALKDTPMPDIVETLEANVKAGTITPEIAEKTKKDIEGYKVALDKTSDNLTPESQASVAGLIQAKDNIIAERDTKDKSLHHLYDKKIEAIDNQIKQISETNNPLQYEVDETTGQPLQKPSFNETAERTVNDLADKISKGKLVEDAMDVQAEHNFPEQLDKALNRILREEKAKNKDSEKPNTELSDNIEKYISKKEKQSEEIKGEPENISQPIELNPEVTNVENKNNEVQQPAEVKEPTITEPNKVESTAEAGTGGKEPPTKEPITEGAFVEPRRTILSHRGLQEVATEYGLDDITSRERKSDLQLFKDAETTINKWVDDGSYPQKVESLVKAAEDKQVLNDEQRLIVQQHLANIRNEANVAREKFGINSKEFDDKLQELKRINRAGMITRSAAGAALRIGDRTSSMVRYDVPDMMAAKMEALNVDKLTETQKSEIEKNSLEIEKRAKVAEEKVAMYEAKIAEYKANEELNKKFRTDTRKPQLKKKTNEDYTIERKNLKDKLKQQFSEFQEAGQKLGIASDGGTESFIISAKMAKTIMEIVKSHVDEVGSKLKEVTKRVFDEVKDIFPNIQEKDIHDIIAGKYNEKSKTKSQLQLDLQELQVEARLISKLEALEKGEVPKTEKALIQYNQKIKELRDKIKASDVNKLTTIKERNIAAANKIIERIKKGEFDKPKEASYLENERVKKAYPQQYKEAMDAIVAKENAQHEFEIALLKDAQSKRSWGKKYIYDPVKDIIGTTKALRTGIDFSAIFIQNIVPLLSHPVVGAKSLAASFRDFASNKKFERALAELHNSKYWSLMQKSGLDITEPKSVEAKNKEEIFNRNLLEKDITIAGKKYNIGKYTTAPFERAFVSLGNHIRAIAFLTEAAKLEMDGKTFESHPKEFKDLAKLLNTQTGRGTLPDFITKSTETVNTVIWSPRLMASRLNLLGIGDVANPLFAGRKGFYAGLTPRMRKRAASDFVQFVGTVLAVYAAAGWITGAQSDLNPQSSTFGEIKDENSTKSYNMFGGFSQYVKLAAILGTGKRKLGEKEEDITDSKGKTRLDIMNKFLRGKVTPVAGAVLNTLEGKDYLGNPTNTQTELENLVTPLSLSGIPADFKRDGLIPAFTNGLISVTGIGVKDSRDFDRKSDKTFTIKNEEEGTKREATQEEYDKYISLRDKLSIELEKELKDNKEVGIDKYGDVTLSEDNIADYKPYDKLSEKEKQDLSAKIKSKAGRQAKKELFGEGQDD